MLIPMDKVLEILDADNSWRQYQVNYPEASSGQMSIEIYKIGQHEMGRLRTIRDEGPDRDPGYGTFRKLVETVPGAGEEGSDLRRVWMSDTRAEIGEHYPFFNKLWWAEPVEHKRLLINGLGLGVVVHGALTYSGIDHIDVVEKDLDIIKLVGQFVTKDPRITVWHADAFEIQWPRGTRWDLAWHDIWPTISDENIPDMDQLMRKYKHRVGWQGCWQRKGCLKMARVMREMKKGILPAWKALEILGGKSSWLL